MQTLEKTDDLFSIHLTNGLMTHRQAWTPQAQRLLPNELLELVVQLHEDFNSRRLELLTARQKRQAEYDAGAVPEYNQDTDAPHRGDWQINPIPADLLKRRVEITGPVSSAKMVINMLNRNADGIRADMAMLDFEDSMKPDWGNVLNGIENVKAAIEGDLSYHDTHKDKHYRLNADDHAKVMVRIRGLHLDETNVQIDGTPISGGLLDLVSVVYHTAKIQLAQGKTPKFYVPKIEHYLEARYWNDVFVAIQQNLGLPEGSLRATFLIETLPAAFQIEEILYELRTHIVGLNVGRWDKIFSDIKVLRNHPDRIMADRASITMGKSWMENYAKRLIKLCHARGAMAIGGMSAFTPGSDPQQRQIQTDRVIADKANEARLGHDGCWVSHPYFIGPALDQFKQDNQLDKQLDDFDLYPDLLPKSEGSISIEGVRTNIRVGIAYLKGWNEGIGCVAWDGLMEDLATLEISRTQIWQWLKNSVRLEDGRTVDMALIHEVFKEEHQRIVDELIEQLEGAELIRQIKAFDQAKQDAETLFTNSQFKEFLSLASELA